MANTPLIHLRLPDDDVPRDASLTETLPPAPPPSMHRHSKMLRTELGKYTTTELKNELLERDCTDFSRWAVFLRNVLWLLIAAAVVMTNIVVRCQDGELYGVVCTIFQ
jgi:hypothetical protein